MNNGGFSSAVAEGESVSCCGRAAKTECVKIKVNVISLPSLSTKDIERGLPFPLFYLDLDFDTFFDFGPYFSRRSIRLSIRSNPLEAA
jgi:hypothetical protein